MNYCTRCGNALSSGTNFCGACGAGVTADFPTYSSVSGVNWRLAIIAGVAAVLVLALGIGSVAAMTLLRSEAGSTEPVAEREELAAADREKTESNKNAGDAATPDPVTKGEEESAQQNENAPKTAEEKPAPEEDSGPAPGYNLVRDPSGSLAVEVPSKWGVETGADSENDGGLNSWSYFAGEYLNSSITSASNLDSWYEGPGASGAYIAASKALAEEYTDYELTHSLLHEGKDQNCTPGPYEDLDRPPYKGKVQAWFDCGVDGATSYTVAAAPEGRECVAVLGARFADEADQEAIEHIVDTLEVDCGRVTAEELVASPPTATATASPSTATASATASASTAAATEQPAGTKHVKVVVTAEVPSDVNISDDNLEVGITEEVTGTKTYEFDIASDSGLFVSLMTMKNHADVSIEVYENGELVSQDTDSTGWAQVAY